MICVCIFMTGTPEGSTESNFIEKYWPGGMNTSIHIPKARNLAKPCYKYSQIINNKKCLVFSKHWFL